MRATWLGVKKRRMCTGAEEGTVVKGEAVRVELRDDNGRSEGIDSDDGDIMEDGINEEEDDEEDEDDNVDGIINNDDANVEGINDDIIDDTVDGAEVNEDDDAVGSIIWVPAVLIVALAAAAAFAFAPGAMTPVFSNAAAICCVSISRLIQTRIDPADTASVAPFACVNSRAIESNMSSFCRMHVTPWLTSSVMRLISARVK